MPWNRQRLPWTCRSAKSRWPAHTLCLPSLFLSYINITKTCLIPGPIFRSSVALLSWTHAKLRGHDWWFFPDKIVCLHCLTSRFKVNIVCEIIKLFFMVALFFSLILVWRPWTALFIHLYIMKYIHHPQLTALFKNCSKCQTQVLAVLARRGGTFL